MIDRAAVRDYGAVALGAAATVAGVTMVVWR